MKISPTTAAALLALALICSACGAGGGGTDVASDGDLRSEEVDTSDRLFEPDKLLQIAIEMDPAEYEVLRQEGRYLSTVFSGCAGIYDYSHFKARVTVDGEVLEDVDIRKKGFLGSLAAGRPSFKLNFDTFSPGRRLQSLERMTLNNNNQDPGSTHTCMSYDMFRAAGVPTPRCNHARVTVNGNDLGIYSHVESIKKHFLRRNFASAEGNLYESQLGDFGEFTQANLQLKTNEEINDRSDLDMVITALEADDENLPGLLGQLVDLDAFITFWAMETITSHWDGATGNANNHFVYREPTSNLFYYIPWGTDAALVQENQLAPGTGPLYRYTIISARLYLIPEYRDQYHARVLELLDKVWDKQALRAEVDRIRDLTGIAEEDLTQVRAFISEYDAKIRAAIAGETTQLERTIVDRPIVCNDEDITTIRGSFSNGQGFFEFVDLEGNLLTVPASVGPPTDDSQVFIGDSVSMTITGSLDGVLYILPVMIETSEFGRSEIPMQGSTTFLLMIKISGGAGFQIGGASGAGSFVFDEPGVLNEPVNMHFSADLLLGDGLFDLFGGRGP